MSQVDLSLFTWGQDIDKNFTKKFFFTSINVKVSYYNVKWVFANKSKFSAVHY